MRCCDRDVALSMAITSLSACGLGRVMRGAEVLQVRPVNKAGPHATMGNDVVDVIAEAVDAFAQTLATFGFFASDLGSKRLPDW